MIDPITGGLIAGGANAVAGALTSQWQYNQTKKLQKMQNDFNADMWQMNAEYNSPASQKRLYEEAGLNPAFFLGDGNSTAQMASSGSAPSPAIQSPDFSFIAKMLQDDDLKKSEAYRNYKEGGKAEAETKTEDMLRDLKAKLLESQKNLTDEQKNEVIANTEKLKAEKAYTDSLKDMNDTQKEALELQIQFYALRQEAELKEIASRIAENYSKVNLNNAQKAWYRCNMGLIRAQIETEHYKQKNLQSETDLNNGVRKDNLISQTNVNNSTAGNIKEQTRGQQITNDVREATKGTEVFAQNFRNVTGPALEVFDFGLKAAGEIRSFGLSRAANKRAEDANQRAWNKEQREMSDWFKNQSSTPYNNPSYSR